MRPRTMSYEARCLGLASFRKSSDLESGTDAADLLFPMEGDADSADPVRLMTLNVPGPEMLNRRTLP